MDIRPIDIMNHAWFVAPGLTGPEFRFKELQIVMSNSIKTFTGSRPNTARTFWGDEIDMTNPPESDPTVDIDRALKAMDEADYDIVVVSATKMWSYRWHHELILDFPVEAVAEAVAKGNGRIIGAASYSPFRIEESLAEVEHAVREYGFRYVWFHPLTFGIPPNDRRCYPLYAKCNELGIPVGLQVGHSAEVLPSEHGRPMLVDDVAIEFPNLKINLSHTGWPWTAEFCSMMWRHPNVYGDTSAYYPHSLDAELVKFMDSSRGRNKVLFGTNHLDLARAKKEFIDLPIKDSTRERVLRQNAVEFLGL